MIKHCEICSAEFEAKGNHAMYCIDCKKKIRKEQDAQKRERMSAIKIERKPIPKPKVSIAEQDRRSKAAGMTYGKYVAKYGEVEK